VRIDLDQVVFMKTKGEQTPADSFPTLDIDDAQGPAARSFSERDHILRHKMLS